MSSSSFHAQEVQPQLAYQVEHAKQMRLIADLADQGGLPDTGLQVQPLEGGREPFCQAYPDRNPVSGRCQVSSQPRVEYNSRAGYLTLVS